jgi:hypothetical protein
VRVNPTVMLSYDQRFDFSAANIGRRHRRLVASGRPVKRPVTRWYSIRTISMLSRLTGRLTGTSMISSPFSRSYPKSR